MDTLIQILIRFWIFFVISGIGLALVTPLIVWHRTNMGKIVFRIWSSSLLTTPNNPEPKQFINPAIVTGLLALLFLVLGLLGTIVKYD